MKDQNQVEDEDRLRVPKNRLRRPKLVQSRRERLK